MNKNLEACKNLLIDSIKNCTDSSPILILSICYKYGFLNFNKYPEEYKHLIQIYKEMKNNEFIGSGISEEDYDKPIFRMHEI